MPSFIIIQLLQVGQLQFLRFCNIVKSRTYKNDLKTICKIFIAIFKKKMMMTLIQTVFLNTFANHNLNLSQIKKIS